MKMLLLAFIAMVGIGFAAAPSMADQDRNNFRGPSHHHHSHGRWDGYRTYYPSYRGPVADCRPYVPAPVYGPRVIYNSPGIYYSGRNVTFGIGF